MTEICRMSTARRFGGVRATILTCIVLASCPLQADLVSELPPVWQDRLTAIPDADLTGAEALMQQAITSAREEIAGLLAADAPDETALGTAYGRLGALLLLVEVEAPADASLRNAMQLDPEAFRWPYYAGYLAMLAGNLDEAIDYLETARAIDPDYAPLYVRLGKVHLDRSELTEARTAFERAIGDETGLAAAAHYYLGQIANLERRFDDAISHLEDALAINPDATEVHYPLAQAYRSQGRNDLAKRHLDQFKLRAPDVPDPLIAELEAATKRSLPAFQRAIHAVRGADYAEAVELFREGLAVDPDNAAARVSYARALYLNDGRDQAATELDRALALEPDSVLANFLRATLLQAAGKTQDASAAYRRVLDIEPDHAGALFYLAGLQFANGDWAAAAEGYRRALAAEPALTPARVLALVAERRAGAADAEVLSRLQALAKTYPDDPRITYALARLLAAAGDPAVRNPGEAMALAGELMIRAPMPPHERAVILAQAAAGDHAEAAGAQRRLIDTVGWMTPPQELGAMKVELEAYEQGRLPPAWPDGDTLLSPPPLMPEGPFRDYPATQPY
jgi:tetratricopeptide (TPR) repeat protein